MRRTTGAPTASELHRRWLELVETEGPFLAVPALKRVWPQGMPAMDPDLRAVMSDAKPVFERVWERWDRHRDDDAALAEYRTGRDHWVETILRDVIGWQESYASDLAALAAAPLAAASPDHRVTVTASGALERDGCLYALVLLVDPVDALQTVLDDGWAASPIDRMEAVLRANDTPVGVVTDGRWRADRGTSPPPRQGDARARLRRGPCRARLRPHHPTRPRHDRRLRAPAG